jgi:hypothetical protein
MCTIVQTQHLSFLFFFSSFASSALISACSSRISRFNDVLLVLVLVLMLMLVLMLVLVFAVAGSCESRVQCLSFMSELIRV